MNSYIDSNVNLISTADNGQGGSFIVNATTSNSPLKLYAPTFAVDASLHLSAHTSNSPAKVILNEAYEGTFNVRTSRWFKSSVQIPPFDRDGRDRSKDPKGEGRKRNALSIGRRDGEYDGWVAWSSQPRQTPPPGSGEVWLSTSNSNAELVV